MNLFNKAHNSNALPYANPQQPQEIELPHDPLLTALLYVETLWAEMERFNPRDLGTLIGLPKPYIASVHSAKKEFNNQEINYWESYFIAQGLIGTRHERWAYDILENLTTMLNRFHIIPATNRFFQTGKSQPPLLTTLIFDLYDRNKNLEWLSSYIAIAKEEYRLVWLASEYPNARNVFKGLSRYYHVEEVHMLAEAESGWSTTPRFHNNCLDYIPVDLNILLWKYEKDFVRAANLLGEHTEAKEWLKRAHARRNAIDKYLWDEKQGFYFDLNYKTGQRSAVWSLAPYYALWSGMVPESKALKLVTHLEKFVFPGGVVTTLPDANAAKFQWAYPNGFAPLQYMVVVGLLRYGFEEQAREIAKRWVAAVLLQFEKHKAFFEAYNVVEPEKLAYMGEAKLKTGYGWTNAIFYKFCAAFNFASMPEVTANAIVESLKRDYLLE